MELSYYSTLFLTILLLVGLVFFLRGATKDRPTTWQLPSTEPTPRIRDYLLQLGYRIKSLEPDRVVLEGRVGASGGLAILLTTLALIGLGCLSLVLSLLLPEWGNSVYLLMGGAPIAGLWYWRSAQKLEQITITTAGENLIIQGHRDTLRGIEHHLNGQG
jgi:hypothetical protein